MHFPTTTRAHAQSNPAEATEFALASLPQFPSAAEMGIKLGSNSGQPKEKAKQTVAWVCAPMKRKFQKRPVGAGVS